MLMQELPQNDCSRQQMTKLGCCSCFLMGDAAQPAEWTVVEPVTQGGEGEVAIGTAYRGTGTMFRYSGLWGRIIEDRSLSEQLASHGLNAITDVSTALQRHPAVMSLWAAFRAFVSDNVRRCGVQRWALAMELHVEASVDLQVPCVHLHWMFDSLIKGFTFCCRDGLRFKAPCLTAPWRLLKPVVVPVSAFNQGHFYLSAGKIGAIFVETSSPILKAYPATPEWITNLWQTEKISSEMAKCLYIAAKRHVKQCTENVRVHTQMCQHLEIQAAKADAKAALERMRRPCVRLQVVEQHFKPQFLSHDFRQKFLVLDGPTRLGKTQYARSLAGDQATFEVNCANCIEPDLREFNPSKHKATVFDEAPASLVLRHKKLFQGGVEEVAMSSSATNMYSYAVWVYGCILIVTSNHWAQDLEDLSEEDAGWLRGNSIVVFCSERLYV